MPRLAFRNPPVHEVILTLQVEGRADLKELDGAWKLLSEPFLTPERVEAHQVEIAGKAFWGQKTMAPIPTVCCLKFLGESDRSPSGYSCTVYTSGAMRWSRVPSVRGGALVFAR